MKAGIIGYGYWGPNQARVFAQVLGSTNVVVVDPICERRDRAIRDVPGSTAVASIDELLSDAAIDIVCICSPADTHFRIAARALASRRHVLVEKPLATNSTQAAELLSLARAHKCALAVGHVYLYSAAVNAVRAQLATSEFGSLRYGYSLRTSLGPRAREDVGVLWDYLVHDVYLFLHLLGPPCSVRAEGRSYLRPGIADVVFASMSFSDDVRIQLQASWLDPVKARRMTLVGSQRMLVYDDLGDADSKVIVCDRGYAPHPGRDAFGNDGYRLYDLGCRAVPIVEREPLLAQCEAFVGSIQGHGDAQASAAAALDVIRVLEAMELSMSENGKPVAPFSEDRDGVHSNGL